MAHGLGYPMACGIFPDQGSNLCFLHWQVDSLPPRHQGRPLVYLNSHSFYSEFIPIYIFSSIIYFDPHLISHLVSLQITSSLLKVCSVRGSISITWLLVKKKITKSQSAAIPDLLEPHLHFNKIFQRIHRQH